jgi:hypothetical protein
MVGRTQNDDTVETGKIPQLEVPYRRYGQNDTARGSGWVAREKQPYRAIRSAWESRIAIRLLRGYERYASYTDGLTSMLVEPTWEEMVAVEPGLARLMLDVQDVYDDRDRRSFCSHGYRLKFQARLQRLAGFQARNPALRSVDAYETALAVILAALPECRNCACCTG